MKNTEYRNVNTNFNYNNLKNNTFNLLQIKELIKKECCLSKPKNKKTTDTVEYSKLLKNDICKDNRSITTKQIKKKAVGEKVASIFISLFAGGIVATSLLCNSLYGPVKVQTDRYNKTPLNIYVDDDFSQENRKKIYTAIENLDKAAKGITFNIMPISEANNNKGIRILKDDYNIDFDKNKTLTAEQDDLVLGTSEVSTWLNLLGDINSTIVLYENYIEQQDSKKLMEQVVTHELMHSLGYSTHSQDYNSLMCATLPYCGKVITNDVVEYLNYKFPSDLER